MRFLPLITTLTALVLSNMVLAAPPAVLPHVDADPFVWMEEIEGGRALAWAARENARSLGQIKADPRYAVLHGQTLEIVNASDRIPEPELIGTTVYNFWQDAAHVRGLWRRTTADDYALATPRWETVIDLDALAAAEGANWVWKGVLCPPPHHARCLVRLSQGGEDAVRVREFDPVAKQFVEGGFDLPRGKQHADWLDDNTLILSRDWGAGSLTASSYPFIVKTLKRGQDLDQAAEVFRGRPDDVSVDPTVLHDGQGHVAVLIVRAVSFFEAETYLLGPKGAIRLPLPLKASVEGLLDGRLIIRLKQDWTAAPGAAPLPQGALIGLDLQAVRDGLPPRVTLLLAPGPRQSIEQVAVTRNRVAVALYDNVRGGLIAFAPDGGSWRGSTLETPPNVSVTLSAAGESDDTLYYHVEGFLDPSRLWRADLASGVQSLVKAAPARFDASTSEVQQFEAVSSDGVKIPYFVVHPKTMKLDGANPTLLYAYGGFEVSMLPAYSAMVGKAWLERGGIYVLANIRGGGEFGPAWHAAGLKTHRQIIYDDFAAVARDLIARKITSPRRLGIEGGSNGGLLMGVEMNQHPDLWRAVVIQVPLLDMLRYEQIGAGASWVGEYGSVANPPEAVFLASISPYHNLRAGVAYPEPFFVTSTKDDRVTPVHARKMAARMQAMGLPFLYFENTNGGHAASANLAERAERVALEFTYLIRKLAD